MKMVRLGLEFGIRVGFGPKLENRIWLGRDRFCLNLRNCYFLRFGTEFLLNLMNRFGPVLGSVPGSVLRSGPVLGSVLLVRSSAGLAGLVQSS